MIFLGFAHSKTERTLNCVTPSLVPECICEIGWEVVLTVLRIILGDQLSGQISSLNGAESQQDIILMCEVTAEATYVKHHKKKLAFIFSAMRHFAEELRVKGYRVDYIRLDQDAPLHSLTEAIEQVLATHKVDHIITTEPGEYRVLMEQQSWAETFDLQSLSKVFDKFKNFFSALRISTIQKIIDLF